MRIDGIILAAGLSSRMGCNKLLLPYKGKPLLQYTLDIVADLPLARCILVTTAATATGVHIPAGMHVIYNTRPEEGQSSSLRLGLAQADGDGYVFFAADQPLLDKAVVERIVAAADPEHIVVPRCHGRLGNPVFFPAVCRSALAALRGDTGGRVVREAFASCCVYIDITDVTALLDVDTYAEYTALCAGQIPQS